MGTRHFTESLHFVDAVFFEKRLTAHKVERIIGDSLS